MEGFHLFQEKIKGDVNRATTGDLHLLFLSPENLLGWDPASLEGLNYESVSYDHSHRCAPSEEDFFDAFGMQEDVFPVIDFKIEYSPSLKETQLQLQDDRHLLSNYNNDIDGVGGDSILMMYD